MYWKRGAVLCFVLVAMVGFVGCAQRATPRPELQEPNAQVVGDSISGPFVLVLGIGQDGGVPQAGKVHDERWFKPEETRFVASLAVVDPATSRFWIIDATPDFPRQLTLASRSVVGDSLLLSGVFLTHAHIGHYTGLMYLGHEAMGANRVNVYSMPRMTTFLRENGPWDQLVKYENIVTETIADRQPVQLSNDLSIEAITVPHRQEYSEVVGYRINGENSSVMYIPDIDSWTELDAEDTSIEDLISTVDVALLDGTFFENGELPGRDMSGFPHPFIRTSMERFSQLPLAERTKINFIHLNHSNPVLQAASTQREELIASDMGVAYRGQVFSLR